MSLVAVVSLEGDDKDGDDVFLDFIDEARGFVDSVAPVTLKVAFLMKFGGQRPPDCFNGLIIPPATSL